MIRRPPRFILPDTLLPYTTLFRSRALLLAGQPQRAEQMLRLSVSRLPVDPQTFLDLSEAAQRLDHLDLAREALVQRDALMSDDDRTRSEEHTSELQSLMRISYAVFCLKKNNRIKSYHESTRI